MRIEHEITGIRVVRFDTIHNALAAVYGKYHLDWVKGAIEGSFRIENQPHVPVLGRALKKQYEAPEDNVYVRDCALAVLEGPWKLTDFYRTIDERGYYAASLSEATAYLRELKARKIKFGSIIHLGTFIVSDEDYREKRLVVKSNGSAELVTAYNGSLLRAPYEVVLSRKPKAPVAPVTPKQRGFFRIM